MWPVPCPSDCRSSRQPRGLLSRQLLFFCEHALPNCSATKLKSNPFLGRDSSLGLWREWYVDRCSVRTIVQGARNIWVCTHANGNAVLLLRNSLGRCSEIFLKPDTLTAQVLNSQTGKSCAAMRNYINSGRDCSLASDCGRPRDVFDHRT